MKITELHNKAMEYAEYAYIARLQGRFADYEKLTRLAYECESEAAMYLVTKYDTEPTRSVMFRSAASLAIECSELRAAEKLICCGLSGNAPEEIAEELRDLYEQVTFERHLVVRGVQLKSDELQISLNGPSVSYGVIESSDFFDRAHSAATLLTRTNDRLISLPFRQGAARQDDQVFFSVPRAASFAMSIKFGNLEGQKKLFSSPTDVLVEMLECLKIFGDDNKKNLRERIADEMYYNNFVALAKKLAPDGDRITLVGLTLIRRGNPVNVALQKPTSEVWTPKKDKKKRYKKIVGVLKAASEQDENNLHFHLVTKKEGPIKIHVQPGILDDIVGPKWGQRVAVLVQHRHNTYHYLSMSRPDESDVDEGDILD